MNCERKAAGHSRTCNRPAFWFVRQTDGSGGTWVCESHCREALLEGHDEVTGVEGEPMMLDGDGDLAVAS